MIVFHKLVINGDFNSEKNCLEENFIWDCIKFQSDFKGDRTKVKESCKLLHNVTECVNENYNICKIMKPVNFVDEINKICSKECIRERLKCDDIELIQDYKECSKKALKECNGSYKVFYNFSPFGKLCFFSLFNSID